MANDVRGKVNSAVSVVVIGRIMIMINVNR